MHRWFNPEFVFIENGIGLAAHAIRDVQPHVFDVIRVVLFMTIICRSCLFNREGHRNDNLIFLFQNLNFTNLKVDIFSMNKLAFFNQHLFDDASLLRVGIDLLIAQYANNTE